MSDLQSPWFALRTETGREPRVNEQLRMRGIEAYLPTYKEDRPWRSVRRREAERALFPGYIFSRFEYEDRFTALNVPGVIELLSFGPTPASVPDLEIENLRVVVATGVAEPWNLLKVGQQVTITHGPFAGIRGRLLKVKNKLRLIVGIDLLNRGASVPLELETYMVTA